MNESNFIDILGWIGAFEVILAYALVSINRVKGSSVFFQLLNLTGGILLIVNTAFLKAFPSTFINIVWVGIAIFALSKRKNETA